MRVLQTLALPLGHVTIFGATVAAPFGAADEARTRYLHLGKVALYQMSYGRIFGAFILAPSRAILSNSGSPRKLAKQDFVGKRRRSAVHHSRTFDEATRIGLEPTTPSVTGWCSNQLSYRAILEQLLLLHYGAADEARTRYLHLGKVALYQMSYGRILETLLGLLTGASDRNRTNDTGIFSPLLYRLSYRGAPDDDYYT